MGNLCSDTQGFGPVPRRGSSGLALWTDVKFNEENLALYSTEAQRRDEQIYDVSYQLFLNLTNSDETGFSGGIRVTFSLKGDYRPSVEDPLCLDFHGQQITNVRINQKFMNRQDIRFFEHKIKLQGNAPWKATSNVVEFQFENSFVNNSAGLHFYKDVKDQRVYIFSHLEPFFCHRFFPCFDQPSIRASIKLSVVVPSKDWNVIANGEETSIKRAPIQSTLAQSCIVKNRFYEFNSDQSGYLWDFKETPPISTYIYNVCAGDYRVVVNTDPEAQTPMRIFASHSKFDYLDSHEVFRVIREGIDFYRDFFSQDFPFAKYDMIYVPEFRIGAMENVGAVTFTDRVLVPPDERTNIHTLYSAYVHLHELAHMWFGNLTTMQWWNDLWLKESFADFCSVTCMTETPSIRSRYEEPELLMFQFLTKALGADLAPTTHPIRVDIKHTGDAVSAFDAISYEKGASWIKTMDSFLGREVVLRGFKKYFERFSFKNTRLEDLVQCLDEAAKEISPNSETNIEAWTNDWLKKSGVNTLMLEIDEDDSSKLNIVQGHAKYGDKQLRAQRIDVKLWFNSSQSMLLKDILVEKAEKTLDILSQVSEETRQEFEENFSNKVYGLINANNRGYCKVVFREAEIGFFGNLIEENPNQLSSVNRSYVWQILWSHVSSGDLKIMHFIALAGENIMKEDNEDIVRFLLQKIQYCLNNGLMVADQMTKYLNENTKKDETLTQFRENILKTKLFKEGTSESLKTQLVNYMINFCYPRDFNYWTELFESREIQSNDGQKYTLNKMQRYKCIMHLARWGLPFNTLFSIEFERDYSEADECAQYRIQGAKKDAFSKRNLWNSYLQPGEWKQSYFESSVACFLNPNDREACAEFADMFFDQVEFVELNFHRDYFATWFESLCPSFLRKPEHLEKYRGLLAKYEGTDKNLFVKLLKNEIEIMHYCIYKIRL